MKTRRGDTGAVLLAALVLAAVLGLLAESLVRLSFERISLFRDTRETQFGQLAARAGANSLKDCLAGSYSGSGAPATIPEACKSEGWREGDWYCSPGPSWSCTTSRAFDGGDMKFELNATWDSAGTMVITAQAQP